MTSSKEIKLRSKLKKIIINFFDFFGYELKRKNNFLDRWGNFIVEANDKEKENLKYFEKMCLTSELNLWSIHQSLKYIHNEKTFRDRGSGFVMKQKAFTLIELLVVVALNQAL